MSFENKIVIVTGAAAGIGKATAKKFAGQGASVIVADLNGDGAAAVVDEIRADGGRAISMTANCGVQEDVQRVVAEAVAQFGGIDVLVNNAAAQEYGGVEEMDLESWESVLRDTLTGPFLMAKFSAAHLRERGGGAIVNIGSVLGVSAVPGAIAYSTSKHGIVGLTRCLALDLGDGGIRVNCICPGVIDTPRVQKEAQRQPDPDKVIRDFGAATPLKRIGQPEEIADTILYLCSDRSSYITGGVYLVDGGMMAALPGALG